MSKTNIITLLILNRSINKLILIIFLLYKSKVNVKYTHKINFYLLKGNNVILVLLIVTHTTNSQPYIKELQLLDGLYSQT